MGFVQMVASEHKIRFVCCVMLRTEYTASVFAQRRAGRQVVVNAKSVIFLLVTPENVCVPPGGLASFELQFGIGKEAERHFSTKGNVVRCTDVDDRCSSQVGSFRNVKRYSKFSTLQGTRNSIPLNLSFR